MTTILASTALVLIAQLTAGLPYRPSVKVTLGGARQFVPLKPKATPGLVIDMHQKPSQVLCSMPMLRPPADVDPKIVIEPPKDGAKIRTIDVPPCIERASR